ncbi:unnamed protein product, partial [Cylicostephanus goldi]
MDRTAVPKCGLKSCKHLCVRSAKDAYECLCPQGYYMDSWQCKVSSETLLIAGDKLLPTANGSTSVFLFHPAVAYKPWRKLAVDYKNELFELWVTHMNGSYTDRLLNSDDTLTAVTVDQTTGNVLVAAEVGRRIGEIILVDPKRIKD